MGKTILTPAQSHFLQLAAKEKEINRAFYLAGGTALSEFYLKHRLSEDLDFFSLEELNEKEIDSFIKKAAKSLQSKILKETKSGFLIYYLKISKEKSLKVDFVYQPFKQLESGKKYHDLEIASIWDITVDKLYTIFHRLIARDFIDLYFGIQETGCSIEQLITALEEKYEMNFEEISLISRFPAVKDVSDYPKMLVPFDKKKMEEFYISLVKSLEKEIFK